MSLLGAGGDIFAVLVVTKRRSDEIQSGAEGNIKHIVSWYNHGNMT